LSPEEIAAHARARATGIAPYDARCVAAGSSR